MKVSINWLKELVNIDNIDANDLAEKITRTGIEVESVEQLSGATNVVVGYVEEKVKHPDSDKLSVCQVNVGEEELQQIVCGAKNVAAGQKVLVAKVGAVLPGGMKIKKAKLRGVASNGMICSLQELGIETKFIPSEYSEGIYVCDNDAPIGIDATEYLNVNDTVLELGLTPNRADCLSMMGVAYEVAAILNEEVNLPEVALSEDDEKTTDLINIDIATNKCNGYFGKVVKGIKISKSPKWLQSRLIAAGIRPINNVVDITNYIMLETGQPLHAFDLDKLEAKDIVVRDARDNEKITTLDDIERELLTSDIVITNNDKPIALAGVMGGANSSIDENTTSILLESAIFDAVSVRRTSSRLNLRSESSARFEKKVDPNRIKLAIERAAQLINELASGTSLTGVAGVNNADISEKEITISTTKINGVLGTTMTDEEVGSCLDKLQFTYELSDGTFVVSVPTRRLDITIKEDIIEEVGRIYGYDNIPLTVPSNNTAGTLNKNQLTRRLAKRTLNGLGLDQAVNYSLTNINNISRFNPTNINYQPVKLKMPMSEERAVFRSTLIPHLLDTIKYNVARNNVDNKFYEIGTAFSLEGEQYKEINLLSGVLTGLYSENKWQQKAEKVDFFLVKGILNTLFYKLGIDSNITYKALASGNKDLHPGRTALIYLNDEYIGFLGQIHPQIQKDMSLSDTIAFEIVLDKIYKVEPSVIKYNPIPKYPSITKDLAFVVNNDVTSEEIRQEIVLTGKKLLKDVTVFDVYTGKGIEDNQKSIAYTLTFRDNEATLTDDIVSERVNKIIKAVESKFNASLRSS